VKIWIRRIISWFLFQDLLRKEDEPIPEGFPDMSINEKYMGLISQEVSRKKIVSINDPDAMERKEAVFETENGIASIRHETLILCSCGKLVSEPFAICAVCKMGIFGPEDFKRCFLCQTGLCSKCVRWFGIKDENGKDSYVPLCEKHYAISKLSGELKREWF